MEELTSAPEAPETPSPAPADTPAAPEPAKAVEETPGDKAAAAEKALDDDLRKTFRNANRERSEDGKFASKDPKPAPAEKLVEAKPPEAEKPPEPAKHAVPPPNSWAKEAKAEWDKLPPKVQETIAQREAESHKAISSLGQFAKAMEPIHNTLSEHADRIRASGKDVATYMADVMRADQALARDPVGFIREIADHFKLDTNAIFDPFSVPSQDAQSQQVTAQLNAAWQEIEHLKRQLGDTRQRVEGREAEEQKARQSQFESDVQAFASDKPDFDELAADIEINCAQIKRSNPTLSAKEVLQQAYDRARWANPATRERLLQAQQAEAEKKRLEQAKQAASTARRSAAINVNGSVPQRGQVSLDDDLRSIWRRAHAN